MKKHNDKEYTPESVGQIMSARIPTCTIDDTYGDIIEIVSRGSWDSIRNVYVIDASGKLAGYIDLTDAKVDDSMTAGAIMKPVSSQLNPRDDQEKAVFIAVKDNMAALPVVDKGGHLLGVVTARTIIGIMHGEHLEDALLNAGIRDAGSDIVRLTTARVGIIFKSRSPWLAGGLLIGLSLGFIGSMFEETLNQSIALAFYIPVVAYIAGSVGAQSSTITIRALAVMKIDFSRYIYRELFTGVLLGMLLGLLGSMGALLISQDLTIAAVVGLALFAASAIAALLATLIPLIFTKIGKDPALGSGPIATALMDVVSVFVYFLIAAVII